eukprot:187202-Alexandrium_andersonii.AAC.1
MQHTISDSGRFWRFRGPMRRGPTIDDSGLDDDGRRRTTTGNLIGSDELVMGPNHKILPRPQQ